LKGELSRGARAAVPVSLGVTAYALVFGMLAFMNLAVFSGSAQFVLVGMWQAGVSAWQMALAAAMKGEPS
jgi:predicted branched-subunit amino acid permease